MDNSWIYIYIHVVVLSAVTYISYGQNAEKNINICDTHDGTRTRSAYVSNPRYPSSLFGARNCSCLVNNTLVTITTRLLLSLGEKNIDSPVIVKYRKGNQLVSWPPDVHVSDADVNNEHMVTIATNVTDVEVIMASGDLSQLLFMLNIQVSDPSNELHVTCGGSYDNSVTTTPTTPTTTKESDPALAYIDDLCSAQLVIILACVCVLLMIILLAVSITLCCVMPKKQKAYLAEIRKSRQMNAEIRRASAAFQTRTAESLIYDDADIKVGMGGTIPAGYSRQSQIHYSNTTDMAPMTYDNV